MINYTDEPKYLLKPHLVRIDPYTKPFKLKPRYSSEDTTDKVKFENCSEYDCSVTYRNKSWNLKNEIRKNVVHNQVSNEKRIIEHQTETINNQRRDNFRKRALTFSSSWANNIWNSSVCQIEISQSIAKTEVLKRIPKFTKKHKTVCKNNFTIHYVTTGSPLPALVKDAIDYLYNNAPKLHFIFRKTGSSSGVKHLYENIVNFIPTDLKETNTYEIAGAVSKYFRYTKECLFTRKFSTMLYNYAQGDKLSLIHNLITLLPESNREALAFWVRLLNQITKNFEQTHMSAYDLAVCMCETIFTRKTSKQSIHSFSLNINAKLNKEINWKNFAIECTELIIKNYDYIFEVNDLGMNIPYIAIKESNSAIYSMIDELVTELYRNINSKEFEDEKSIVGDKLLNVDLQSKSTQDSFLKMWKCSTVVRCDSKTAADTIFENKLGWFVQNEWNVVNKLASDTEIVKFNEKWVVDRICHMLCHKKRIENQMAIVGCSLADSSHGKCTIVNCEFFAYFLESSGEFCKLTHFLCIDTKGRSLQWNNTVLGSRIKFVIADLRHKLELQ